MPIEVMLTIKATDISKKFKQEWIFKSFSGAFQEGNSYAITGPNGSGKSTLLQILAGFQLPSKGEISYWLGDIKIDPDQYYRHIAFAAPYLTLPESLTLKELLHSHFMLKETKNGMTIDGMIVSLGLQKAENKLIKNFSSGMLQRVRLGLVFFSDAKAIFLDEPTTNLDASGIAWYQNLISEFKISEKMLFIASNQSYEYDFCTDTIDILRFKSAKGIS